jgi:MFS family permease
VVPVITAPRRIDRLILHLAVAANTIGLGVILALLADLQDAYGLPTSGLGLIAAAAFITSFVAYIALAKYADLGHAKGMLIAGSALGALALVLAAFARDLWTLVAARALLGLAEGAFVPAARRMVLDWEPDRPGEVLGRIVAAAVAGFALGPLLGAVLAEYFGLRVPFLVPAAILLVTVPVVTRLRPPAPIEVVDGRSIVSLFGNRLVLAGLAFAMIEFATFGSFDAVWARLLTDLGASTGVVGLGFTIIALPLIFLAPRFGRIVDARTPTTVALLSMVLITPAIAAYGWLTVPALLILVAVLHGVGSAALGPASAALVAAGSPPHLVARGQGLMEAIGFLAAAAAALPTGWAYEGIGRGAWFSGLAGAGVALAALGWGLGRHRGDRPQPAR